MGKIKALYHDFDPFKCEVMREAIKAGAIADGEVICGDINEIKASELMGYTQCHFFAGGGFWSLALRQAGWPDDRPVWTGSCPCPSFSEAGKGEGFDDDRHLWPVWDTLIGECRPPVLFGEQSHAAIGFGWLDLVCGNLEAKDYSVAAAVLGAHSVGAPHRRQRLYFAADRCTAGSGANTNRGRSQLQSEQRCSGLQSEVDGEREAQFSTGAHDSISFDGANSDGRNAGTERKQPSRKQRLLADKCGTSNGPNTEDSDRRSGEWGAQEGTRTDEERRGRPASIADACDSPNPSGEGYSEQQRGRDESQRPSENSGHVSDALGVEIDAKCEGLEGHFGNVREWRGPGWLDPLTARSVAEAGATRGYWADCDWWYGRDEKYRPIGPGLFPLATRATSRVGRLRIYGDSIVIPCATAFIKAYLASRR